MSDSRTPLNPAERKPSTQPKPRDAGKDHPLDPATGSAPDSLVSSDMEEPAETNRPPLGN